MGRIDPGIFWMLVIIAVLVGLLKWKDTNHESSCVRLCVVKGTIHLLDRDRRNDRCFCRVNDEWKLETVF
jgi:hypothetical protein